MLDLDRLDLDQLCTALEDRTELSSWWIDTTTGELHLYGDSMWDGEPVDEDYAPPARYRRVEPLDTSDAYSDLGDFTARVRDPHAREQLKGAIAGRGAFRRFKDTLLRFPELRKTWFTFHDARMERRAIEWLRDEGLITDEAADRAMAAKSDPDLPTISGPFDAHQIAKEVAADLRTLYGHRLKKVLLYGSWARGDARADSDIDLLVVLDRVDDRWNERLRMGSVLYEHSLENDTVVSAVPVSEAEFERPVRPMMADARKEAVPVT